MRIRCTKFFSWIFTTACVLCASLSLSAGTLAGRGDTTLLHLNKKAKTSYLRPTYHMSMPQMSPVKIPAKANAQPDDKLLSDVQVYPTLVTDQINLKYFISKNSNVTIKIMDVLGNEIATLFSQRVDPGEKKFSYNLSNKLNSGFYFVRVVVGSESVIKRISVL